MNGRRTLGVLSLFFAGVFFLGLSAGPAAAAYPEKPITIIVPWAPGGASDITPRTLTKPMSEDLKQPVLIVNKPGAAGVTGTLELEKSAPDGYTIGTYSFSQALTQYTSPNPTRLANVVVICKVMYSPGTITVTANFPAKTLKEFIDYAKANPGKIRSSNSGKGASAHIFGEAFDKLVGIKETHVPFAGYAPAVSAVAGGHIEATSIPVGDVYAMVKAGKMRVLAVMSEERHFLIPEVPTMKELGINLDMGNWVGFIAPKGVPPEIIDKLDRAIGKSLKNPEVIKSWREMGNVMAYQDHKTFTEWMKPHDAYIRNLVDGLGLYIAPRK